ncbi:MAG TPA: M15 family metallopeptidase [Candidatus Paceibacterota bacterium]
MKKAVLKSISNSSTIALLLLLIAFAAFGFNTWSYYQLRQDLEKTQELFMAALTRISELENNITAAKTENSDLISKLAAEQERNNALQNQLSGITNTVGSLSSTVGTLEKLRQTDKELLQKYSKVYFLNENYIPKQLVEINPEYVFNGDQPIQIHAQVWPYLQNLLTTAENNDAALQIISGYRSFGIQSSLKSTYSVIYGTGANRFSADQGYSEHQLGTTIDFTTPTLGAAFTKFEPTASYKWLTENAYKYGFILSYPKENSYYIFEPWHWRFVGVTLAAKLQAEGKYFYNLDQREIDQYLIMIFD